MTFYTVLKIMEEYNMDYNNTILTISKQASKVNGTSACLKEGD
jgi:D-alanyl-D-alanine carboxypeptidase